MTEYGDGDKTHGHLPQRGMTGWEKRFSHEITERKRRNHYASKDWFAGLTE